MVSLVILVLLSHLMIESLSPPLKHSVFESSALVFSVWLSGDMGKYLSLSNSKPKICCCDADSTDLINSRAVCHFYYYMI